jgi:hypothetical protein
VTDDTLCTCGHRHGAHSFTEPHPCRDYIHLSDGELIHYVECPCRAFVSDDKTVGES